MTEKLHLDADMTFAAVMATMQYATDEREDILYVMLSDQGEYVTFPLCRECAVPLDDRTGLELRRSGDDLAVSCQGIRIHELELDEELGCGPWTIRVTRTRSNAEYHGRVITQKLSF